MVSSTCLTGMANEIVKKPPLCLDLSLFVIIPFVVVKVEVSLQLPSKILFAHMVSLNLAGLSSCQVPWLKRRAKFKPGANLGS